MSPHMEAPSMQTFAERMEAAETTKCKLGDAASDHERPFTPRRSTDPTSATFMPLSTKGTTLALPPRNRSPYSRSHLRTRSSVNTFVASSSVPPMARAHSSPILETFSQLHVTPRPSSPLLSSGRRRSPLRPPLEDSYSSFVNQVDIGETIAENSELDLTPKSPSTSTSVGYSGHNTFPRSRRRPASPLQNILQPPIRYGATLPRAKLHTSTSLPTLNTSGRYNESYPSSFGGSSSSLPSTPTSLRSRSPSISSLETIPDIPDAEQEAQDAYNLARLKAAADGATDFGERRRRGTLDVPGRGSGAMVGGLLGGRDKRKRWSVCGAERRGDLDLETIWEDGT